MAPIRKTGNTIEVATWAFNLTAALAVPFFLAIGGIFWNLAVGSADLGARVKALEQFANSGDRWTAVEGKRDSARISRLESWRIEHTREIGEYRSKFQSLERQLNQLESHVSD